MHIGKKISEVLYTRHLTKTELGTAIGISGSTASYLTRRSSIDVEALAKIGNVLQYNFFKHYPITEAGGIALPENIELAELKSKNEMMTKDAEATKQRLQMLEQENGYLKKINELLDGKK